MCHVYNHLVTCRLLAWATDIEAQLGLQRQELRRTRVELASAQEVVPTSLDPRPSTPNKRDKFMTFYVHALYRQPTVVCRLLLPMGGMYMPFRIASASERCRGPALTMTPCRALSTSSPGAAMFSCKQPLCDLNVVYAHLQAEFVLASCQPVLVQS